MNCIKSRMNTIQSIADNLKCQMLLECDQIDDMIVKKTYGDRYTVENNRSLEEIGLHKKLGQLVKRNKTPHINLPICAFNNADGLVLITEKIGTCDLIKFIIKNNDNLSLLCWKALMFQILSTHSIIKTNYPELTNFIFSPESINIYKGIDDGYNSYKINNYKYYVPNVGCNVVYNVRHGMPLDFFVELKQQINVNRIPYPVIRDFINNNNMSLDNVFFDDFKCPDGIPDITRMFASSVSSSGSTYSYIGSMLESDDKHMDMDNDMDKDMDKDMDMDMDKRMDKDVDERMLISGDSYYPGHMVEIDNYVDGKDIVVKDDESNKSMFSGWFGWF
jgi:hypothetical protein